MAYWRLFKSDANIFQNALVCYYQALTVHSTAVFSMCRLGIISQSREQLHLCLGQPLGQDSFPSLIINIQIYQFCSINYPFIVSLSPPSILFNIDKQLDNIDMPVYCAYLYIEPGWTLTIYVRQMAGQLQEFQLLY